MKYEVITRNGMPVYGPESLKKCEKYLKQAESKGSNPGVLSIVTVEGKR